MQCSRPLRLMDKKSLALNPQGLLVPCGKCTPCRIAYRRMWTIRMFHELNYHNDSIFVTLTYDDNNIPVNRSLRKDHLQKFFKRLRRRIDQKDDTHKIKYYACGEYGSRTNRPHYHSIIFGLSLWPDDKELIMDSWPFCNWSVDRIRNKAFGLAETTSIEYVAGYINKKFTGELAHEQYTKQGREPVFRLMSQGIGRDYCDVYSDQLMADKSLIYKGKELSLPRYYVNRLNIDVNELKERSLEIDAQFVEKTTGVYMTSDEMYLAGELHNETISVINRDRAVRHQRERNINTKLNLYVRDIE